MFALDVGGRPTVGYELVELASQNLPFCPGPFHI
jgi:hypothetical protein